tara:strand:+ start:45 stop:509 length:465 start_codon:yes stop_codon:yes gene_type:complete
MSSYFSGPVHNTSSSQIWGTWRWYRGSYGTYASETANKTILTISRWYWSTHLPLIIETFYEAYSGTGYSRSLISGYTKNGSNMGITHLENNDADEPSIASTTDAGSGSYPHWTSVTISSGAYRRGTYRIFYNPSVEKSTEAAAKAASDGFYIHN